MSRRPIRLAAIVVAACLLGCSPGEGPAPPTTGGVANADLVLLGGSVVTMDADRTVLEDGGIAIRDGAIVAVDTAERIAAAWTGERTLDPFTVLDSVRPLRIDPVGRYAIKITWTDGHDTGIYSFDHLRSLAEGEKRKSP